LITGYEYDIFISYRHKDNKYDGWVSEFVADLRKELEAILRKTLQFTSMKTHTMDCFQYALGNSKGIQMRPQMKRSLAYMLEWRSSSEKSGG